MKKRTWFYLWTVLMWPSISYAALSINLDNIVITTNRMEEESYKIAGNVSVITKKQIEESNAQNVADILSDAVGVHIYESGTTKARTIDMRGFGDTASRNILVLVNGRKINNVDISGPNLFQVPLGSVERIEIIRGGSSVLYGDNAVGGVINIITKEGKGPVSGKAGYHYTSYKGKGADVEVSGAERGLSYYLYSKYSDEKGFRTNSDVLTRDFNSRFTYEVSEFLKFDVNVGWHKDDVGTPGGLNEAELQMLSRSGSANPDDFANTKDQFIRTSMEITPWQDSEYLGDLIIDWYYRDRDVFDSLDSMFGAFTSNRDVKTRAVTTKYVFDKSVFDKDLNIVTGIDLYDTENDILARGPFGDDDLTIHKNEFGIFGYLQYEILENLFLNAGKRRQKAKYSFDQRNINSYEQREPKETVAMGGVKYEYAQGSNVHFNFQQTFRFLSTDEWYSTFSGLSTDLEQQTGKQYEIGLKHNFNNKAIVSVTGYLMDIDNEIFFDPTDGLFGDNSNYGKTQRVGLEFSNRIDILEFLDHRSDHVNQLEVFLNYTYQQPEFDDGQFDGMDIPMVPRHQTSHGFIAKIFKYYKFSLSGRYVGARYAINDTSNATPKEKPYYVVDGKVSFERKNLEVFVAINNLFDMKYNTLVVKSATSSVKDFFPAPEKNFRFGVNIRF